MQEKVSMVKMKLFTGKMNLQLKKRIMKCLVWMQQDSRWLASGRAVMFSLHAYCLHHLAVITNPEEGKVLGVICFHTRELGLGNHGVGNKWTLTPAHSIIQLCSSKNCKWHNVILDFVFDVEYFCTVGSSSTLCCCLCASNHRRMFLPRHNRRHPLEFPVSLFLTYAWCIVQWVECIFVNPIPATPIVLEIGP